MSMDNNPISSEMEKVKKQIRVARDRMQQLWKERGYTDADVLNASIELDCLLNQYQVLEKEINRCK